MKQNLEYRTLQLNAPSEGSRTIEGRAIVFNEESELLYGQFREVILPEAITQEWIDTQDVRILYNHLDGCVSLARHKSDGSGTLELRVEPDGLYIKFDAPKTSFGDEILDACRRGDIDKMSFCCIVAEDGEKWVNRGNDYLRIVSKYDMICECSLLDIMPAYSATSVSLRSLEAFKEKETRDAQEDELKRLEEAKKKEEEEAEIKKQKEEEEARRKEELEKYYSELKSKLD